MEDNFHVIDCPVERSLGKELREAYSQQSARH
jgi:hypothetical protein